MVGIRTQPEPPGVGQDRLRETEQAFHVEFLQLQICEFYFHEGDVLAEFVALAMVRLAVDAVLVQECLLNYRFTAA